MLLFEHDAKVLLARHGVPVPDGAIFSASQNPAAFVTGDGPWMLKSQVTAGKRGKGGGIARCQSRECLRTEAARMNGLKLGPHTVRHLRVETCVDFVDEVYFSLEYEAASGLIRLMFSSSGGIDVEEAPEGTLFQAMARTDAADIAAAAERMSRNLSPHHGAVLKSATGTIGQAFLAIDATMIEINPLFIQADGSWIAGDAKVILDENALFRQEDVKSFLLAAGDRYEETVFKLENEFDLIVLDPDGDTGLVTTGAGLTMMLVDELAGRDIRAYNFLDIRTGMIHSDPARLVVALEQIVKGPRVSSILINIFAGITDLRNFAERFVEATQRVDVSGVRFVARLEGLNKQAAREIFLASGLDVTLAETLDEAVEGLARP